MNIPLNIPQEAADYVLQNHSTISETVDEQVISGIKVRVYREYFVEFSDDSATDVNHPINPITDKEHSL